MSASGGKNPVRKKTKKVAVVSDSHVGESGAGDVAADALDVIVDVAGAVIEIAGDAVETAGEVAGSVIENLGDICP